MSETITSSTPTDNATKSATDAPPASGDAGEFVSRSLLETVQKALKQRDEELLKKEAELKVARSKSSWLDESNAEYVRNKTDTIKGFLKDAMDTADNHEQTHLQPLVRWSEDLGTRAPEDLYNEMPMVVAVCCASARLKRGQEAEAALEEKDKEIQDMYKQQESYKQRLAKSMRALDDMTAFAEEQSKSQEEMLARFQAQTGFRRLPYDATEKRADFKRVSEQAQEVKRDIGEELGLSASSNSTSACSLSNSTSAPSTGAGSSLNATEQHGSLIQTTAAVASMGATSATKSPLSASLADYIRQSSAPGSARFMPTDGLQNAYLNGKAKAIM
jgi:myosin heavy subunit